MASESWVLDGLELNVPGVGQLTNLVPNPSFETGVAGWVTDDDGVVGAFAASGAQFVSGVQSASLGHTSGGTYTGIVTSPRMPVTTGLPYSVASSIRPDIAGRTLTVNVQWWTALSGGSVVSSASTSVTGAAGWNRVLLENQVAPPTAVAAVIYMRVFAPANGSTVYFDAAQFTQSTTAGTYFDGSVPGYQWSGTAHASTSVPAPQIKLMDLTADPPPARRDWITAADSEAAALFRQPLHENRTITMKLRITPQASMDTALDKVGILVDKLRAASATPAGISLVWTPNGSTRSRTFNVLAGEITGLPIALSGDGYSWLLNSPIVTVEMTCHPYWLGTETLTSTASSSTPFVTLEVPNVTGDVPALGRLIVTDTATQSRRHVEWGLEGPLTYNSGLSLLIDSDNLVTSGFAGTGSTLTGAYDPNAAGNNVIQTTVFASPQAVCGTGVLSHVGSFRVKARVNNGSDPTGIYWRLVWRVSDSAYTTNATVSTNIPGWVELDFGTITIPAVLSGTQAWDARVEAWKPAATDVVRLDYLTLVPVKDGYGKARASYAYTPGVIVGSDSFDSTTAGNALNARVAPAGGTWATSGDATDFVFADAPGSSETVTRSAISGTAGRIALLGTSTPTDVQVQAATYLVSSPSIAGNLDIGVIARYVDASNYLYATYRRNGTTIVRTVEIRQVLAGAETLLASVVYPAISHSAWWTVRLIVSAAGVARAQLLSAGGVEVVSITAASTALATAGALASGKSGLFDRNTTADTFCVRYYDSVYVSTPSPEPIVLYSGRNMQIRYDDAFRQDSTGTYVGRPASYRGSRFLVPVGTSRVLVKARRNDIEASADDNVTDATQVQVGWTPRGLAVPR